MQENIINETKGEETAQADSSPKQKEAGFSLGFRLWLLLLIIAILGIDQYSKHLVMTNLAQSENIIVIDDFFYITHIRNPGVAFGMFSDLPDGLRVPVLTFMAGIAMSLVIFYSLKLRRSEWLSQVSLHMIFAGAVGNQLDRFFHGSVTDFLLFRHGNWSFPAFNIADSAIVVGVCFLLIDTLFPALTRKKVENGSEEGEGAVKAIEEGSGS